MIDAVIKDQKTGKPVISQTFRSIREVKRWIDKEYRHKPEESGMWITLLFKDNSEQPFYENVRF